MLPRRGNEKMSIRKVPKSNREVCLHVINEHVRIELRGASGKQFMRQEIEGLYDRVAANNALYQKAIYMSLDYGFYRPSFDLWRKTCLKVAREHIQLLEFQGHLKEEA